MDGKAQLYYRDGATKLVDLSEKRPDGLLDNLKQIVFFAPKGQIIRVAIPEGKTGRIFRRVFNAVNGGTVRHIRVAYAVGYDDHLTWIEND